MTPTRTDRLPVADQPLRAPEASAAPEGAPLFSLIVLNWNGRHHLAYCLPALAALDYARCEVIVVDNASEDGSIDFVRESFPAVRVIRNDHNLGFPAGMNVGLRAAQGEYIGLLNNDVVLRPGWPSAMAEALSRDPRIAIAGCKLLYPDEQTLQHAGGLLRYPLVLPDHYGYRERDQGQHDAPREVDYVTAAALAVRRAALAEIGEMDEAYEFYYEETDWAFRARRVGWKVVYVPGATAVHHESATIVRDSFAYHRRFHRSRFRFAFKHYGRRAFLADIFPAELDRLKSLDSPAELKALRTVFLEALLTFSQITALDPEPDDPWAWREVVKAFEQLRAAATDRWFEVTLSHQTG